MLVANIRSVLRLVRQATALVRVRVLAHECGDMHVFVVPVVVANRRGRIDERAKSQNDAKLDEAFAVEEQQQITAPRGGLAPKRRTVLASRSSE